MVIFDPFAELVRTSTNWFQLWVVGSNGLFVDNVAERRQRADQATPVGFGRDAHLGVVHHVHAFERREENRVRRGELFVRQPSKGVLDVGASELLPVVKEGIIDQIELPGRVVQLLPGFRQAGHELIVGRDVHQLGEDVVVDLNG